MLVEGTDPTKLPVFQHATKEDRAWRDLQARWGLHGLPLSRSLVRLEAAVNKALAHAEDNPSALITLHRLKEDINEQVTTPLTHALHMVGGSFNNLSNKRCKHFAKRMKDHQLGHLLEDTDKTLTHLFPLDVSGAMEAFRARRTDGLLTMASRAVSSAQAASRHASSSSLGSFLGRLAEP